MLFLEMGRGWCFDGTDSFEPKGLPLERLGQLLWTRCQNTAEALKASDLVGNVSPYGDSSHLNPTRQLRPISSTAWHRLQFREAAFLSAKCSCPCHDTRVHCNFIPTPMSTGQEWIQEVREKIEAAHGYYELGMQHEAWMALDELPPKDKAHPLVMLLRLDILIALKRWEDAVALGTGACQSWPVIDGFFLTTTTALLFLGNHGKARDLLLSGPPSLQQKAVYWYRLACCHGRLGEIDKSRKCLWECINRDRSFREVALDNPDLEGVWKSL